MSSGGAPASRCDPGQVVEHLLGGARQLADPALEEVAGERRLGEEEEFRRLGQPATSRSTAPSRARLPA